MEKIAFGMVYHANQYIITNNYSNRDGLDDFIDGQKSNNGYPKVLELHQTYNIPFNLHLSGTLLESILWYCPKFISHLKELEQQGLLGIIGSSYGQNIMRFFSHEHNLKQLNEELRLYERHLNIDPEKVKVFWPPERVWDTERLMPVLTDSRLLNGGYKYILLDDRLMYPLEDESLCRKTFDKNRKRRVEDFAMYDILGGNGLLSLPISTDLRLNLPPDKPESIHQIWELLHWLKSVDNRGSENLIAIFGDDMEKFTGKGGWDIAGPAKHEEFLKWLVENSWIRPVLLDEWASTHCSFGKKRIDIGTFIEMSNHFDAGEGYQKWYFDPLWDKYKSFYDWSEKRVKKLTSKDADPALSELAWKHLLVSGWETAWHTPSTGVHGDPDDNGAPSPWAKAIASHSRSAAVIAEAAHAMNHKDNQARAYLFDIDNDGEEELILKNNKLFAVFSPMWGGRLIYLFNIDGKKGRMVIGNPSDDWNWMEELNKYMEVPANHPGALTDKGFEHDQYDPLIKVGSGKKVRVRLTNCQKDSNAFGTQKNLSLAHDSNRIGVKYKIPKHLNSFKIKCGLSPDYLRLLRHGRKTMEEFREENTWGYSSNGVAVWVKLGKDRKTAIDKAGQHDFGHGMALNLDTSSDRFKFSIGTGQTKHQ